MAEIGGNAINPYKCPICDTMISPFPHTVLATNLVCDRCGTSIIEKSWAIVRYIADTEEENKSHVFEVLSNFPQCSKCGTYTGAIRVKCSSKNPTDVTQEFEKLVKNDL